MNAGTARCGRGLGLAVVVAVSFATGACTPGPPIRGAEVAPTPQLVTLGDQTGVQSVARDGQSTWRWTPAPRPSDPMEVLEFDAGGTARVDSDDGHCRLHTPTGSFLVRCGSQWVYFDGYTLAVIADQPWTVIAQAQLGHAGTQLLQSEYEETATIAAGGVEVFVQGTVFSE